MLSSSQVEDLIMGIREASAILMAYYRDPHLNITQKADASPVTAADLASHNFWVSWLAERYPGIPLISEEGEKEDYEIRKTREYSWILDPLDGTKEFIACNDEFAINLALLHRERPVFGIIAVPAKNTIYYAIKGKGSWRIGEDGTRNRLPLCTSDHLRTKRLTVLVSRSHAGAEEKAYCQMLEERGWQVDVRPAGSAYKHTLLAEGSAHIYYKPGICWEWDTAPGQVIIEEAGGSVVRLDNGKPLIYNKPVFSNPRLIMLAPGVAIPL